MKEVWVNDLFEITNKVLIRNEESMQHIETDNLDIYICLVGMIRTNCYIVTDKKSREAIIIDPGEAANKIEDIIISENIKPQAIFLTHGHFDHILAVSDVVNKFQIDVYAGEEEEELLMDVVLNCSKQFRRECIVKPDETFCDGQIIDIAGLEFKSIHTPGHTKGSYCFYFKEDKVLFSGDTLFRESVGRTDFPTGSSTQLLRSVRDKLLNLEDDVRVYTGHGEETTIAYERANNMYI